MHLGVLLDPVYSGPRKSKVSGTRAQTLQRGERERQTGIPRFRKKATTVGYVSVDAARDFFDERDVLRQVVAFY